MNCRKCGNVIYEGDSVCRVCGEAVQPLSQPVTQPVVQQQAPVQQPVGQPVAQPVEQPVQQAPVQSTPQPQQVNQSSVNPGMGVNNQSMYNQGQVGGQPVNNQPGVNPMAQPMMPNANQAQPMNFNQPIDSGMNSMNYNQQTPKKNNLFIIIVIALVVVIIGLGGFVAYKVISTSNDNKVVEKDKKDSDNKKDKEDKDEDKDDDKNKDKDDDKNDNKVVSDSNVVEYYGYKFVIPTGVKYQKDASSTLTFSDSVNFMSSFGLGSYDYEELVTDPSAVIAELQATGITLGSYKEKVINNRKFFCIQVSSQGSVGIFYFTKLDELNSAFGLMLGKSSDGYQKGFEIVAKIVDSATSVSNFAPVNEDEKNVSINKTIVQDNEYGSVEYSLE